MKLIRNCVLATSILLFSSCILSCSQNIRQVVPIEVDADEVFKALTPNDDGSPETLTFGPDSIPGQILNFEMTTQSSEVYVFFDNFTLLDVNPGINQDLFSFISYYMKAENFVGDSFELPENFYKNLINEGKSFSEAAEKILDLEKEAFNAEVESQNITNAFNLTFQIYPVYLDKGYITYREYCYCYTGGAHGVQYSFLKTYSLSTGELLSIHDIVKPEGMESVREEVVAQMAYAYPIYENITTIDQYIDSLNVWLDNFDNPDNNSKITIKDFPLSNPAITEEGLAFLYQMYELTPGSDGCPLIVIPYKDIKGCLYPPFDK